MCLCLKQNEFIQSSIYNTFRYIQKLSNNPNGLPTADRYVIKLLLPTGANNTIIIIIIIIIQCYYYIGDGKNTMKCT